jgi:hypothetical protein
MERPTPPLLKKRPHFETDTYLGENILVMDLETKASSNLTN